MTADAIAVVPTYRPDEGQLRALVGRLTALGLPVLLADDASPDTADCVLRWAQGAGAMVIRHDRNKGIARSLNAGLAFARERGVSWLLTVDQDSSIPDGYLDELLATAITAGARLGSDAVGAVAAGAIDDASGALGYPVKEVDGVATTQEVIQTGTLWSVAALTEIGGFDERLGIDGVDAAACLALRRSGRLIVLSREVTIVHRLGEGRQVRVLGRDVMASGHSPARRTTIVRNRLRLFPPEFKQDPIHALRTLRRVFVTTALAVTIEDHRWAKAKASARGLLPARDR